MAAVSDAVILARLTDILKLSPAQMPSYWADTIVPRSHLSGYQTVAGTLIRRGYTLAQVDAWDRLSEFESDMSLHFCLRDGGAYKAVDKATLEGLDRREELAEVIIFVSGVPVIPADSGNVTMQIGTGRIEDASSDTWHYGGPDDDQNTRW